VLIASGVYLDYDRLIAAVKEILVGVRRAVNWNRAARMMTAVTTTSCEGCTAGERPAATADKPGYDADQGRVSPSTRQNVSQRHTDNLYEPGCCCAS